VIGEKERYHGIAIYRLIRGAQGSSVAVEAIEGFGGVAYLINGRVPIYLKYSTSRISPWAFSFAVEQRVNVTELRGTYGLAWLVFVCGNEGVVAADWEWASQELIRSPDLGAFSLTISRRRLHQFRISGAGAQGGSIPIAEKTYPDAVLVSSI
jgi:hypothetical protein